MSILFQIELRAFLYTNLLEVGVWSNDILFKTWQLWGVFFTFQISLHFLIPIIFISLHGVYVF